MADMNKLETKARWLWTVQAIIISIILSLIVGVAGIVFNFAWIAPIVFLILSITGVAYSFARYRNWAYELRDDYLYLEYGVLTKVKTKVPYVRIQHIDTQRNVFDRLLGLSNLVVFTAGSRGADVSIPALLPDKADSLQEELRKVAVDSEDAYGDGV